MVDQQMAETIVEWDQGEVATVSRMFEICSGPSKIDAAMIDSTHPYKKGNGIRFVHDDLE